MSEMYDAVVVGGGLVGLATAAALRERGLERVIVLEADRIGAGVTTYSAGGVRRQFTTPLQLALVPHSFEYWENAEQRLGAPCPFHKDGYLLLTSRTEMLAEQGVPMAVEPPVILSSQELVERFPWLTLDEGMSGIWSSGDGRVNPTLALAAHAHHAARLGVEIRPGFPVTAVDRDGAEWVVTGPSEIRARAVVLAAERDGAELLRPFGLELSMPVDQRFCAYLPCPSGMPTPFLIDLDTGLSVIREEDRLRLSVGGGARQGNSPKDAEELISAMREELAKRAPSLAGLPVVGVAEAGLLMNADGLPYVGEVADGLWLICFMGTGIMHGPVVAGIVAGRIAGEKDEFDLSPWDPKRQLGNQNTVPWYRPVPTSTTVTV